MKIITNKNTQLKLKLDHSENLEETQTISLFSGKELNLHQFQEINGHLSTKFYLLKEHWEAVESSPNQTAIANCDDDENQIKIKNQFDCIKKYLPAERPLSLRFGVNYIRGNNLINSNVATNAMYLDWLLRVVGKRGLRITDNGILNDEDYLKEVLKRGDLIYHHIQTEVIKKMGFKTKWMDDKNYSFVKSLLLIGFPVVANIFHEGGKMILLVGINNNMIVIHDPCGDVRNGKYSKISEDAFINQWQKGYRILEW